MSVTNLMNDKIGIPIIVRQVVAVLMAANAAALLLDPALRASPLRFSLFALLAAGGCATFAQLLRSGYLTKTPAQIRADVLRQGVRNRTVVTDLAETLALMLGVVAFIIIA